MQAITRALCNTKVGISKHGTLSPTYNELKNELCSTNNVAYDLWFCHDGITCCVSGNKKEVCVGLAYDAQYLATEVRYYSNKGECVSAQRCRISIATWGGIVYSS